MLPEHVTINLQDIITWAAGIGIMGGAIVYMIKAVRPILTPFRNVEKTVKEHDGYFKNDRERLDSHDKVIAAMAEDNRIICKSLLLLMEHAVTGNSVDKLKKGKQALQDHLINR